MNIENLSMDKIILLIIISFLLGIAVGFLLVDYTSKRINQKKFNQNTEFFNLILKSLSNAKFISRINNNVEISIDLLNDKISLYYILNKNDIVIFRGQECIKTSDNSDRKVIDKIIYEILLKWKDRINSIVNMNGSIIDKNTYTRIVNNTKNDQNELNKILSLDDILDRINEIGFEKLSNEEKEYLRGFGNV